MSKRSKQYHLSLEDDAHLERVARWKVTPFRVVLLAIVALLIMCGLGVTIVFTTPLKRMLPGYLKESQRSQSEDTYVRLDSLQAAYARNEAFMTNILNVLDTDRTPSDSLSVSRRTGDVTSDSLLPPSAREKKFMTQMQEREKFNISVLAPLAAESMLFYPVSTEGVPTAATRHARRASVVMARGAAVNAIADGTVLSVVRTPQGASVIMQHPKGFISRISGIANILVGEGEKVAGGQSIGSAGASYLSVELWHNGEALAPFDFISPHPSAAPSIIPTSMFPADNDTVAPKKPKDEPAKEDATKEA